MSIQNITPTSSFSYCPVISGIDSEEKEIMNRLLAYGCTPTGDKATDRAHLHRIEEEHAKQDNYVSNKYYTVSQAECQRIQDRKKENHKINNPDKINIHEKRDGAKLLGEQIFITLKMKDKKELSTCDKDNKKKAA